MTQKQIEKELDRQAVLFEEKVKTGQYVDGNIRFQDFAKRWFEDYGKEHLRERTYLRYVELSKRTYSAIGHIRLDRLQPNHLLDFCLLYTSWPASSYKAHHDAHFTPDSWDSGQYFCSFILVVPFVVTMENVAGCNVAVFLNSANFLYTLIAYISVSYTHLDVYKRQL